MKSLELSGKVSHHPLNKKIREFREHQQDKKKERQQTSRLEGAGLRQNVREGKAAHRIRGQHSQGA